MEKDKHNLNAIEFFKIEDKYLFLDKVLIDLNMQPLFFICKDENGLYYICLCTDYEEFCYIIVPSSADEIYQMLSGEITIREVFLNKDYFFSVESYNDLEDHKVKKLDIKDINKDELLYEGKRYKILNQSDIQYLEEIKKEAESKNDAQMARYVLNKDDLVNYVINQYKKKTAIDISPLKLQKTMYLLFGMWGGNAAKINEDIDKGEGTIEITEKLPVNLFDANFEAWKYGPVDVEIYNRYKYNMYWGGIESLTNFITASQEIRSLLIEFIDSILKQVFEVNDFSLVSTTQNDKVWKDAYKNKDNVKMNSEDIIKEYKEKLTKSKA